MLSKLAVRRLTKLADFMDALPREARNHFDMGSFFRHTGGHEVRSAAAALSKLDCGTSGCALGWAATIPEFKKAGLRIVNDGSYHGSIQFKHFDEMDFESAQIFFDISDKHANYLFEANKNMEHRHIVIRTPKQWARHCRKFIKGNTK